MLGPLQSSEAQEPAATTLRETLSRTGVFFRADAPYVLRHAEDAHLPVFLQIINGVEKTGKSALSLVTRVVSREPLKLEGVNIFAKPPGARREFQSHPLRLGPSQDFSLDLRADGQPLTITDRFQKTLQIPRELLRAYLAEHYVGGPFEVADLKVAIRVSGWPSQDFYLRVRLRADPLPRISHWYRGDPHYHSAFTSNPAERGYPLSVTKQAALHTGLDWVVLADHSTDLTPELYAEALQQVAGFRDGRFLFIRGEELTLASAKDTLLTTVHLVALPAPDDPDRGFASSQAGSSPVITTGDGSVTTPAMPVQEALARLHAAGGFAYAAHPFDPISPILRGGVWDLDLDLLAPEGKGLRAPLVGLQAWNRATELTADNARDPFCLQLFADSGGCFRFDKDADQYARLEKGIAVGWRPLLLKGLAAAEAAPDLVPWKVFLAAGSDAHGDFNYEATMDAVDFLSKPSRGLSGYAEDNAFGKLATVVHCPHGMGVRGENVLHGLRSGRSVVSNGPLLVVGFDRNGNGSLDDEEDILPGQEFSAELANVPPLQLNWVSSSEFGPLRSLRLIVGASAGESEPEEIPIPAGKEISSEGLHALDLQSRLARLHGAWGYLRLEARTRNDAGREFRCYTNPIWVRVLAP
jgi:hypothetical protein